MTQQSLAASQHNGDRSDIKQDIKQPLPPLPTVGPPLDGSQYQNIVEEQKYSSQYPSTPEK